MCVSHKIISWNSFALKERDYLSNKASTEKWTLFLVMSNLWHITNNVFSFQRNTCAFLTKPFHEIHTLLKNVVIFQSKVSTETKNTVLILKILWHITNNDFSFQRKTCELLTKAFHEVHTLSNERDYVSK